MTDAAVDEDLEIVDFHRGLTSVQMEKLVQVDTIPSELIAKAQKNFQTCEGEISDNGLVTEHKPETCTVYEHRDFPGLRLLPGLLPPECQKMLVDRLLHRDLSNPLHKTNIHHDFNITYPPTPTGSAQPSSFFSLPHSSRDHTLNPLNPLSNHKPMNTVQFMQKKLRWLTLGSQYDWTTRSYPAVSPTPFPPDVSALVTTLFQNSFTPESGVVLLYSPKDYMPVHRDVSEECQRGLASFSLGCDGLFIIARNKNPRDEGNENAEQEMVVIRVRSGDVVQMDGETRWSWHAMPKVMAGTCPEWLKDWPATEGGRKDYEKWRGYMAGKRLNISCRQVWG
ncbi:Clavaminate synthase-like protein [Venustampulla echinocandica]|uniref:mRNA N(6)-methyladenine demethylase n=1 Tax=Venustampulla echinocandica TaxID=2656787 RepID=A0A370U1N6_9HELO|nr:Clavaminate synthase-like protein [Venustampulla echinocandica]RDL41671.1 Clavaminate synthase-like protein [Venustampulla echinocandica]